MDFNAHGFDSGVKLNRLEPSLVGPQLLHQVASAVQRVGKLRKPLRPLTRGFFT